MNASAEVSENLHSIEILNPECLIYTDYLSKTLQPLVLCNIEASYYDLELNSARKNSVNRSCIVQKGVMQLHCFFLQRDQHSITHLLLDLTQNGSQFTFFLIAPLQAFCQLVYILSSCPFSLLPIGKR